MAVPTITYGTLDLNDGVTWTLLEGFFPGVRRKTFEEVRSYSGAVAQYNVTEANLIQMTVPLLVRADSLVNLDAAVAALNARIDAGPQTLTYNGVSYACVHSERVGYTHTSRELNQFWTTLVFSPWRMP